MIMPYGYPFVQWAPKEHELKIHNLNQAIKPPKLQVLPPDSLTTSRQKGLWKVCGDLHASFALYTNPTHAESKKGLKTKALIYLPTLKKWKNLDLDGTECYPMYFGDWMVFQLTEMNPKSRPEKRFVYPSRPIGKFVIVHLVDGNTYTIQLDANSSVLHVDKANVLIQEKNTLFLLPLDKIGTPEERKSRRTLCKDPLVSYVQYALPVKKRPVVTLPKDSAWSIPKDKSDKSKVPSVKSVESPKNRNPVD